MTTDTNALPCYSIIVPVYNGADTLARCLTTLTSQDYPHERYEIIVVDDGSIDDTLAIARQFPVRLIELPSNKGRVVARNTGAQSAKYERLVFVDARVTVPPNFLRSIEEINYLPLNPHVFTKSQGGGWFNRFFTLFRARYYSPYYPLTEEEAHSVPPILLQEKGWARLPKGTTSFACTREMWFAAQPERRGKHVSDDTLILEAIQRQKPIMRVFTPSVTYEQREELGQALRHLFERGPRFADYYLRPGGAYFKLGVTLLVAFLVCLGGLSGLAVKAGPGAAAFVAAALALLMLIGAGLYLARRPSDVPLVMTLLPLIVGAFGTGVVCGLYMIYFRNSSKTSSDPENP
jgi:glycosyltransferase involved in cell wall biosynthesis